MRKFLVGVAVGALAPLILAAVTDPASVRTAAVFVLWCFVRATAYVS